MNFSKEGAQTAVTISALLTGGFYTIRKVTEKESAIAQSKNATEQFKALFGQAPLLDWGQFVKAWGALYLTLAIIAAASPAVGGGFAVLVGASSVLGNLPAVRQDLGMGSQANLTHEAERQDREAKQGR